MALQTRVRELEDRSGQTSSNSSCPPVVGSTPSASAPEGTPDLKRGLPGHRRACHALLPMEQVDEVAEFARKAAGSVGSGYLRLPAAVVVGSSGIRWYSATPGPTGDRVPDGRAALCRELSMWWSALWIFAKVRACSPPTMRPSEPLAGGGVAQGSFGSDNEAGSRSAERLLTWWPPAGSRDGRSWTSWWLRSRRRSGGVGRRRCCPHHKGTERLHRSCDRDPARAIATGEEIFTAKLANATISLTSSDVIITRKKGEPSNSIPLRDIGWTHITDAKWSAVGWIQFMLNNHPETWIIHPDATVARQDRCTVIFHSNHRELAINCKRLIEMLQDNPALFGRLPSLR